MDQDVISGRREADSQAKTPREEDVSANRNLLAQLNSLIITIDEGSTEHVQPDTSLDTALDVGMVHDNDTQ